jgi:hypothetical protein
MDFAREKASLERGKPIILFFFLQKLFRQLFDPGDAVLA